MRPNYAQDPPPTDITVGGVAYPCETDYRVWIEVLRLMEDISFDETPEGLVRLANQIEQIEALVFGGVLRDEDPVEVMGAVAEFSKGYPTAPHQGMSRTAPVFSFEYDLNEIIIAIRNQSGIDLSYRRTEPFHWWEFLLEFRTLCGDHFILNLMDIRGYDGSDQKLRRRKQEHALPEKYSASEREAYEAWSAEFDDSPRAGRED